jgi:hypothetical protein
MDLEDVPIQLGRTTTLGEIRLQPQPVELEPIIVSARRTVIDPASATTGANLTRDMYETLPIDRDYQSVIALLPQANTSYLEQFDPDPVNIGGSTGLENVYYIEGLNVTDPYRGLGGTELPYNFVGEVQVQQGGYEAEHGRALGGIINILTPSGGDEFRFSAFGFFNNDALTATGKRGVWDLGVQGASDYDFGVSAAGPIIRSRLWFFAAYNPHIQTQDLELPGVGVYEDRTTTHRFAGKLSWRAGRETDITLAVFGDPTRQRRSSNLWAYPPPTSLANPDPLLGDWTLGGVNVSLRGRSLLSPRLLLEASLGHSWRNEDVQGATERGRTEPYFQDFTTGTLSGGYGYSEDIDVARTSGRLVGTVFLGRHTAKVGVAYEENRLDIAADYLDRGIILRFEPDYYFVFEGDNNSRVRNRVPTVYVQDSWLVTDRLTLNLGLRWDGQYLIGTGDSVAQSITDQWQPRLAFVFQPGELGSQRIFGSAGRYYMQMPLFYSVLMHTDRDDCSAESAEDPRDPTVELDFWCSPMPQGSKVEGMHGEHFDELTLGYERALGSNTKLTIRGIYRRLGDVVGYGLLPQDEGFEVVTGNTGRGELSFLPEPTRDYSALELTLDGMAGQRLRYLASYVLSRTDGNYSGLYVGDHGIALPGSNEMLHLPEQGPNSTGLLPNDRTHVFRLFGSYALNFGLTAGAFFTLQSGTPLNELGAGRVVFRQVNLIPRGTAGRTSTIWDLNLRLMYDFGRRDLGGVSARLILDLLHVGNPQRVVLTDQTRYLALDPDTGEQTAPNATFGEPLNHQPPMTLRLGLEVSY